MRGVAVSVPCVDDSGDPEVQTTAVARLGTVLRIDEPVVSCHVLTLPEHRGLVVVGKWGRVNLLLAGVRGRSQGGEATPCDDPQAPSLPTTKTECNLPGRVRCSAVCGGCVLVGTTCGTFAVDLLPALCFRPPSQCTRRMNHAEPSLDFRRVASGHHVLSFECEHNSRGCTGAVGCKGPLAWFQDGRIAHLGEG